jgi:hypothetical protein
MKTEFKISKLFLKILSFFISIIIWIFIQNSQRVHFQQKILVDYVLPDGMTFRDHMPREIILKLEGPRMFSTMITESTPAIVLNLNNKLKKKNNKFFLEIDSSLFKTPIGVNIEKIDPSFVEFRMDKKITKKVDIKPRFSGKLPSNLSLKNLELSQDQIEISGPESLLSKIDFIETKAIELEGLIGATEIPVEMSLQDDRFQFFEKKDLKLKFKFEVLKPNLILNNIPVRILSDVEEAKISHKFVSLELFVSDHLVNRPELSSQIEVGVEIPKNKKRKMILPLNVILPVGVYLYKMSPKSIIVNLP